jgi:adenine phosphoribosyltransferase
MTRPEDAASQLDRDLRAVIRDVPDFPKPGILFKDVTPLLGTPDLFRRVSDRMATGHGVGAVQHVVGIESRGFIFGAPVALALGAGFVPVRKPGKLPARSIREDYALEYGTDSLEIHADAIVEGAGVLVVDDVLATGGTAAATCRLVERAGGRVVGCVFLIELAALGGRGRLRGIPVDSVLAY